MDPILKFATFILLSSVAFTSCKKENYVPPVVIAPLGGKTDSASLSTSPRNSLLGQEFIFNELVWSYDVDGGGNLYIYV